MAAEVLPVRLAASGGVMVLLGRVELVEQRQPLEQQLPEAMDRGVGQATGPGRIGLPLLGGERAIVAAAEITSSDAPAPTSRSSSAPKRLAPFSIRAIRPSMPSSTAATMMAATANFHSNRSER